jgi:hypothetical protein
MPNNRVPKLEDEGSRQPFTTIDDLTQQAEALVGGLRRLGQYKYPLDIRRGIGKRGKGVKRMADSESSKTVKSGSKTYFFDIKETKEGKNYLVITESRFKGEGQDRERNSIVVFPEDADNFSAAVSEMTAKLG